MSASVIILSVRFNWRRQVNSSRCGSSVATAGMRNFTSSIPTALSHVGPGSLHQETHAIDLAEEVVAEQRSQPHPVADGSPFGIK